MVFSVSALSESPSSFSVALLFIVAVKLAYDLLKRNSISLQFPPGPKPKFLIGNALDFPKGNAGRVFAEWGKQCNSDIVVHANAFGNHVVVINSLKLAEELFERRAQLYNDRPVIPIVEVMGAGRTMWLYSDTATFGGNTGKFVGRISTTMLPPQFFVCHRICVGKAVASDLMWLVIATFLACFNTGKAKDELGNEIELDDSFNESGVIIHKKPFKCSITPRSEQIKNLLESTANH